MVTCYIGLGSNLGDREQNIRLAIDKIKQIKETRVTKESSVIETKAAVGPPQGKFLNAVAEIQTALPPEELLKSLQRIESELGRVRTIRYGPRTIDLDILFYGDRKISNKCLIVPHPKIKKRDFVLVPLTEIAPHIVNNLLYENHPKN